MLCKRVVESQEGPVAASTFIEDKAECEGDVDEEEESEGEQDVSGLIDDG